MISKYIGYIGKIAVDLSLIIGSLLFSYLIMLALFVLKLLLILILALASTISYFFLLPSLLIVIIFQNQSGHKSSITKISDKRSKPAITKSISIVILNWNGEVFFDGLFPPILKQIKFHDEIIVVDNGSSDESLRTLSLKFPQVQVLPLEKNYFFSKGNNFGLNIVNNEIVIFLNTDMIIGPNFLDTMRLHFDKSNIFSVTSEIFFWNKRKKREETGRTRASLKFGKFVLEHIPTLKKPFTDYVFWSGGGSSAFSTEKLKSLNGFSQIYSPFYWEDVDLSYRAWKNGWISLIDTRAVVLHKHQGSSAKITHFYVEMIKDRNRHLFTWSNISSHSILFEYFIFLLPRIFYTLMKGDLSPAISFICAIPLLPVALDQRQITLNNSVVSDEEIFKITNGKKISVF